MSDTAKMQIVDTVLGTDATCYWEFDGRRYNMMQLKDCEFKFDVNMVDVAVLGKTGVGGRATSWKGTFSGNAYFNQSVTRKMYQTFKETGILPEFTIYVTNTGGPNVGQQSSIFKGCQMDGGILAKFSTGDGVLEESISGRFDDFDFPEHFKDLPGM